VATVGVDARELALVRGFARALEAAGRGEGSSGAIDGAARLSCVVMIGKGSSLHLVASFAQGKFHVRVKGLHTGTHTASEAAALGQDLVEAATAAKAVEAVLALLLELGPWKTDQELLETARGVGAKYEGRAGLAALCRAAGIDPAKVSARIKARARAQRDGV
jgi:hypothetical protein